MLAKLKMSYLILPLVMSFAASASDFSPYVDADGNISLPDHFRTQMAHIGSWFVPDGDVSGFHDVFTEKESLEAYRKTDDFPDGATLVKEVRAHRSGNFTTGANVSYSDNTKLWFVMVRDTENRFPHNKVWAEGWGWALINTDDPNKNVATDFANDCKACHLPAQKSNWVFVEGYPTSHE